MSKCANLLFFLRAVWVKAYCFSVLWRGSRRLFVDVWKSVEIIFLFRPTILLIVQYIGFTSTAPALLYYLVIVLGSPPRLCCLTHLAVQEHIKNTLRVFASLHGLRSSYPLILLMMCCIVSSGISGSCHMPARSGRCVGGRAARFLSLEGLHLCRCPLRRTFQQLHGLDEASMHRRGQCSFLL